MRKIIASVFLIVIVMGGLWLFTRSKPTADESSNVTLVEPNQTGATTDVPALIIGQSDARVTIVEYGDFQCPICKRFFEQTEPQLLSDYIDTGKAKIEFRVETHSGQESAAAGEAAYCANDQGKFKAYHDELYIRQSTPNSGTFSGVNLKRIAGDIGLEPSAFSACLDGGIYRQAVIDSDNEAKQRISGTPTFFIEDQKITGAQPFSVFKTVIDAATR